MGSTARVTGDDLPTGMTVDDFVAWYDGRSGRYELHNGRVLAMTAERVGHVVRKARVYRALTAAVESQRTGCHVLADGAAVRIDDRKWYEPDALVYCGAPASDDALFIENPVIVVEVTSPSTSELDATRKLDGYFSLPSVQHSLIVSPDGPPMLHYRRNDDGTLLTRIVHSGTIVLDPPGLEIDISEFFA